MSATRAMLNNTVFTISKPVFQITDMLNIAKLVQECPVHVQLNSFKGGLPRFKFSVLEK